MKSVSGDYRGVGIGKEGTSCSDERIAFAYATLHDSYMAASAAQKEGEWYGGSS